jgi:hypothetical protein
MQDYRYPAENPGQILRDEIAHSRNITVCALPLC